MRKIPCLMCQSTRFHSITSRNGLDIGFCLECGFMFMNPQPDDQDIRDLYGLDYWDGYQAALGLAKKAERYDNDVKLGRIRIANLHTHTHALADLTNVLDIGCGVGGLLTAVKELGGIATGLEINESVATLAANNSGCSVRHGVLVRDSRMLVDLLSNGGFTTIFMNDVLEHEPEPEIMLAVVKGMLTKNGVLVIEMPCRSSFRALRGGVEWKHIKSEHLFYFHTHELKFLLERLRFKCIATAFPVEGRMAMYACKE